MVGSGKGFTLVFDSSAVAVGRGNGFTRVLISALVVGY